MNELKKNELKTKIRELLPKMHFLDKKVLDGISENLEIFSLEELGKIHKQLQEVDEKTIEYFDKVLQKNPRFFEQARIFLMKKREEKANKDDKQELLNLLDELTTI